MDVDPKDGQPESDVSCRQDGELMGAAGSFRSALYYRLNVFPVVLPALRERREDVASFNTSCRSLRAG